VSPDAALGGQHEQERFDRDGYVVLEGLDVARLNELRRAVEPLVRPVMPLFSLYRGDDAELRRRLDRTVRPALDEVLGLRFTGQRLFLGSVLVKFPDPDGDLDLHQDWTFVDEAKHRSGLAWVPLADVGEADGALRVVPGSHRLPVPGRGLPIEPVPIDPVREELERRAVSVPCPFGSAVVYDHRVVHGSRPNVGQQPRLAAVVGFAPHLATLRHHCLDPAGAPQVLEVDDHFFQEYQPGAPPPTGHVLSATSAGGGGRPLDHRDMRRLPASGWPGERRLRERFGRLIHR
jgi:hypothetical protein